MSDIGIFGTVFRQYERKGQKAVNFLLRQKNGEVPNAIFHPEIGWIDIVWGMPGTKHSDGYGLSKIAKYHPEVIKNLATIISSLNIVSRTDNRYRLKGNGYEAGISRMYFESHKTWLLTLFKAKNPKGR